MKSLSRTFGSSVTLSVSPTTALGWCLLHKTPRHVWRIKTGSRSSIVGVGHGTYSKLVQRTGNARDSLPRLTPWRKHPQKRRLPHVRRNSRRFGAVAVFKDYSSRLRHWGTLWEQLTGRMDCRIEVWRWWRRLPWYGGGCMMVWTSISLTRKAFPHCLRKASRLDSETNNNSLRKEQLPQRSCWIWSWRGRKKLLKVLMPTSLEIDGHLAAFVEVSNTTALWRCQTLVRNYCLNGDYKRIWILNSEMLTGPGF